MSYLHLWITMTSKKIQLISSTPQCCGSLSALSHFHQWNLQFCRIKSSKSVWRWCSVRLQNQYANYIVECIWAYQRRSRSKWFVVMLASRWGTQPISKIGCLKHHNSINTRQDSKKKQQLNCLFIDWHIGQSTNHWNGIDKRLLYRMAKNKQKKSKSTKKTTGNANNIRMAYILKRPKKKREKKTVINLENLCESINFKIFHKFDNNYKLAVDFLCLLRTHTLSLSPSLSLGRCVVDILAELQFLPIKMGDVGQFDTWFCCCLVRFFVIYWECQQIIQSLSSLSERLYTQSVMTIRIPCFFFVQ